MKSCCVFTAIISSVLFASGSALSAGKDVNPSAFTSCGWSDQVEACLGYTASTQRQLAFLKKHLKMD